MYPSGDEKGVIVEGKLLHAYQKRKQRYLLSRNYKADILFWDNQRSTATASAGRAGRVGQAFGAQERPYLFPIMLAALICTLPLLTALASEQLSSRAGTETS